MPGGAKFMAGVQHRFALDGLTIRHNREAHSVRGARAEVQSNGFGLTRRSYLIITGPGFSWSARIDSVTIGKATGFAAKVNVAAAGLAD